MVLNSNFNRISLLAAFYRTVTINNIFLHFRSPHQRVKRKSIFIKRSLEHKRLYLKITNDNGFSLHICVDCAYVSVVRVLRM